ncbi:MAG: serine/threonine-protein kinase [Polyangiaceae bacterium]
MPYGVARDADEIRLDHLFESSPDLFAHRWHLRGRSIPDRHFRTAGALTSASSATSTHAGRRSSREVARVADPVGLVGQVLFTKYRVDGVLGIGGFAAVLRATHLLMKTQVAIKMLRPEVTSRRPDLASLLAREAELAAKLDHPNVVRMLDVVESEAGAFIVMEHVDGDSLATLLRKGPLPRRRVAEIGLDVVHGLAAGLERGLIHRDVKPGNVMVSRRGAVKLVDFGLALSSADDLFRRNQPVGTRGYAAPEQLTEPATIDFRADMFGLGATLYHAAVGTPPFPGDRWTADPRTLASAGSAPPALHPEAVVDGSLGRLLTWLLQRRREDRPASYDLVERALASVIGEMPPENRR